ncbi:amidophosphoribosyltransferase [Marasmius sp. AFHP31]|nr:amidophosphoribosyltransferase [Marasmius sp. AFHP31]
MTKNVKNSMLVKPDKHALKGMPVDTGPDDQTPFLDEISVYRSRMAMGDVLADRVKSVLKEHKISADVVIPVA